jgi:hypothetical protein
MELLRLSRPARLHGAQRGRGTAGIRPADGAEVGFDLDLLEALSGR